MALGSAALAAGGEPSERLQARLQHFSGGLLIGAVITDIFPILRSRLLVGGGNDAGTAEVDWHNFAAGVVGFCAALFLMYGVKSLGLEELGDTEAADAAAGAPAAEDAGWARRLPDALRGLLAAWGLGGGGRGSPQVAPSALPPATKEPLLPSAAAAGAGSAPPGPLGVNGGAAEEPRGNLRLAVAKLMARAASLGQLAKAEDVDREAVDEEVHGLDFLIDVARRRCHSDAAEPIDAPCAARLRVHVADLAEDVSCVRRMDVADLPAIDLQLQAIAGTLRRIHSHAEQRGAAFRRWGPRPQPQNEASPQVSSFSGWSPPGTAAATPLGVGATALVPQSKSATPATSAGGTLAAQDGGGTAPMPWGLVLAVLIDSVVDGMLIGLAGSVALASGWLMAMATAIEMGFLGYSFACAVSEPAAGRGGPMLRLVVLGLPPAAMLVAATAAAAGASDVEQQPAFVSLIAFALAAVLFMVVEELLLEAHEQEGSDQWHISVWLYVGLLLSICLDVASESE